MSSSRLMFRGRPPSRKSCLRPCLSSWHRHQWKNCVPRLKQRHTESPSDLDLRMKTAREELKKLPLFDYMVFNRQGEIDRAVADIEAIIAAEKCRVTPRELTL